MKNLFLVFALLCFAACEEKKKPGADDTTHDHEHAHEHGEGSGNLTGEQADSIVRNTPQVAQDTVNMVALPTMYEGDIVFQTFASEQCKAIEAATKSKYSHVGIVFIRPRNGEFVVFEAALDSVRFVPLREWVNRGDGQHVLVMRLKGAAKILNERKMKLLKEEARKFRRLPYDPYFGWGNDRMYCSELVWKIYHGALSLRLNHLRKLKSFDLTSELVKKQLKEKYGKNIPLEEDVISPQDLIDSPLLEKVYER